MSLIKRLILFGVVFLALASVALGIVSRKAPEYLRLSLEKSLRKPVSIQAIRYYFPNEFELRGFEIKEATPFEGETAFYVDEVRLHVSIAELAQKRLKIDKITVNEAEVVIRKRGDKIYHALSGAASADGSPTAATPAANADQGKADEWSGLIPLSIQEFVLSKSRFTFMDYDISETGFAMNLTDIEARIRNIVLPYDGSNTAYEISARVVQGRDERSAELRAKGWTNFSNRDTDTNVVVSNLFLPHFAPYYSQVTPAQMQSGFLTGRINLRIENNELSLNADLELLSLLFGSYEAENQLFGMNADQILSFLKDRSGKLQFQITANWNIEDKNVRARDVIRRSIKQSLKNTVLGNVGNLLENTLKRLGEQEGNDSKSEAKDVVKKIKDFLKFD